MQSLYVHIPFCEKKCLFCSFVVSIEQTQRIDAYLACLEKEMNKYKGTEVRSLYIGGGTPTLLSPGQLQKLSDIIRLNFCFQNGAEYTIEANPESIDEEKAGALHKMGVNRVSLGAQSLNDKYLKYLGRCHNSETVPRAFNYLRDAGFENINVDLMYSFSGQTEQEVRDDINGVCGFNSEHLSLYTLTIEKNSRFYAQKVKAGDAHEEAGYYSMVVGALADFGFNQYEISNFCRPEMESKHNQNYWLGGNYIGVGVGAHSHQDGRRSWNVSKLMEYIERIQDNASAEAGFEVLTDRERLIERFLLGLRTIEGSNIEKLESELGCVLDKEKREMLNEFIEKGLLIRDHNNIKPSLEGKLLLDELSSRLI